MISHIACSLYLRSAPKRSQDIIDTPGSRVTIACVSRRKRGFRRPAQEKVTMKTPAAPGEALRERSPLFRRSLRFRLGMTLAVAIAGAAAVFSILISAHSRQRCPLPDHLPEPADRRGHPAQHPVRDAAEPPRAGGADHRGGEPHPRDREDPHLRQGGRDHHLDAPERDRHPRRQDRRGLLPLPQRPAGRCSRLSGDERHRIYRSSRRAPGARHHRRHPQRAGLLDRGLPRPSGVGDRARGARRRLLARRLRRQRDAATSSPWSGSPRRWRS